MLIQIGFDKPYPKGSHTKKKKESEPSSYIVNHKRFSLKKLRGYTCCIVKIGSLEFLRH